MEAPGLPSSGAPPRVRHHSPLPALVASTRDPNLRPPQPAGQLHCSGVPSRGRCTKRRWKCSFFSPVGTPATTTPRSKDVGRWGARVGLPTWFHPTFNPRKTMQRSRSPLNGLGNQSYACRKTVTVKPLVGLDGNMPRLGARHLSLIVPCIPKPHQRTANVPA